jgi:ubiquinone/menaquinone biosynthesis C-methylase UbiE
VSENRPDNNAGESLAVPNSEVSIPVLTPITDPVSLKVAAYYSETPYPSYDTIPAATRVMTPSQLINALNPWAGLQPQDWETSPEILVAGCGTGQQAFRVTQSFPGARVLAIDLSLPSLEYAVRKYRGSGLSNIEFAQADILQLPSIGRSFDVIEVGGVLHHMADPWQGFRAIVSVLRKGGYVRPALYSKSVRQHIYAIRDWALKNGFTGDMDGVRRFRDALVRLPPHPILDLIRNSPDFSTLNELRDLVFHPHEHPVTIAEIADNLASNNLRFLGFGFRNAQALPFFQRGGYGPADQLSSWAAFEADNPLAFAAMYDFWAQKL